MPEIIAGTYELLQVLGEGGGGVAYLARHLRLDKLVVLKADKRRLTTKPELLRREIDVLKNLSHPYIPQVYDFFTEDDTVYSVIEFVEGESLDKPLKSGVRFPQAQVVRWGKQLLEAVVYLHSPIHGDPPRGYVHADIKPANIMCRPNGDICLIDFNIALIIGEANLIGATVGYASPEHYGLDYSLLSGVTTAGREPAVNGATTMPARPSDMRSASSQQSIIPDERSDIYSIGATLYHLLSGRRPPKNALEVQKLSELEASPQLCEIIAKAMEPNPELRYQTAADMLAAFRELIPNDPRAIRLKRQIRRSAIVFGASLLLGLALGVGGLALRAAEARSAQERAEQAEAAAQTARERAEERETAERTEKEAERLAREREQRAARALELIAASRERLAQGDDRGAASHAAEALLLETPYDAQAQLALTDALGVYELSDSFRSTRTVTLPSEPFLIRLSPAGTRLCAVYAWELAVFDTESGARLAALPVEPSALAEAVFLDEDRLLYAGPGALQAYELSSGTTLWSGEAATKLARSGDGTRAAAIYKDRSEAILYDTATGERLYTLSLEGKKQRVPVEDTFANPGDSLLALNRDGTLLAVSFSDGSLRIIDPRNRASDYDVAGPEVVGSAAFQHYEGGFCGRYFAYSGFLNQNGGQAQLAVVDTWEPGFVLTGSETSAYHVQADETGIYVSSQNIVNSFLMEEERSRELAFMAKDVIAFRHAGAFTIVATKEQQFQIFDQAAAEVPADAIPAEYACDLVDLAGETAAIGSRSSPELRLLRRRDRSDAQVGVYDPELAHSELRVSADGQRIMLFRYDRFAVCGLDGALIREAEIPDADAVYDQQFRRQDGASWLEIVYRDGLIRRYSAADGQLLSEERGPAPDLSYQEEFLTDRYRIVSPLHGTPAAYDRESGALVTELQAEDLLDYVTQAGDCVVAQYHPNSAEHVPYGVLLNEALEPVATLPRLCDVWEGWLYFDDGAGNVRSALIFSRPELLVLAEDLLR